MSLAVLAAMVVGGSSAQAAAPGDTDFACVFSGLSGQLSNPLPPVSSEVGAPDIEQGDYNFSTGGVANADCAGRYHGVPFVDPAATISSTGSYDNIYCGTGFAHDLDGNGTDIHAGPMNIGPTADGSVFGYEIDFDGGSGPLLIGAPVSLAKTVVGLPQIPKSGSQSNDPTATTTPRSDYVGKGDVNIVPDGAPAPAGSGSGGNCVTTSVNQFHVTGHFTAASK